MRTHPSRIGQTINKYHYLLSAAFYRYISKSDNVTFVFVQTAEPFTVEIFEPTALQLDEAAELMDAALNRFDACWRANDWPDDLSLSKVEAEPMDDDDDPLMMPFAKIAAPCRQRYELPVGELAL